MPLVQAKCTGCGANLDVESTSEVSVCRYCGASFIVEKAINNYKITNEIRDSVVNIYSGEYKSADDLLEKGAALVKIGDYKSGLTVYSLITKDFPGNWKGWWGCVICGTDGGMTYTVSSQVPFWYKSAQRLAPENEFVQCANWYEGYCRAMAGVRLPGEIGNLKKRMTGLFSDIGTAKSEIFRIKTDITGKADKKIRNILALPLIAYGLYCFGYKGIYLGAIQDTANGSLPTQNVSWIILGALLAATAIIQFNSDVVFANKPKLQILMSQLKKTRIDIENHKAEVEVDKQIVNGDINMIRQKIYNSMIAEIRQ